MTPVVDERIAERRRKVRDERRRRRLRRTMTVLGLLALLAVGYAVERSSLVALSDVEVVGASSVDPEAVLAAADLSLGRSILRLDLAAAEEAVAALPRVRSADARRVDPLTVRITLVERVPVLTATAGDASVLVDADGIVVAAGAWGDLPTVVLADRTSLPRPGSPVARHSALAAAVAVHRGLPTDLQRRLVRLHARAPDDVDLRLRLGKGEQVTVRFGDAGRADEKSRALRAVLADVREADVSSIDVRAPSAPVVRS